MTFYELTVPDQGANAVLVEVPHAGLAVPDAVRHQLVAPRAALTRDADIYVDKLCANVPEMGATLLSAVVSRYVVDLNRAENDIDRETVPDHPAPRAMQPRGVVWRMTTDGRPALSKPLRFGELRERLDRFYVPYHKALRGQLERLRDRYGHAILVAAHSMPSTGRGHSAEKNGRRADVVPGTRGGTTAHRRVIEIVDAHFRAAGLSVRHDDPYRGGFSTGYYGRPNEHWHAVQIELNRSLYVNEETGEPRQGDFERLAQLMDGLVAELGRVRF